MRVFIVLAHPEPKSFNAALTYTATQALRAAGHEVAVSDLYAMGWDPVSDRRNFTTCLDPEYFKQQVEEQHAASHEGFAEDVRLEQEKLFWCDVLIFPVPAVVVWFACDLERLGRPRVCCRRSRLWRWQVVRPGCVC